MCQDRSGRLREDKSRQEAQDNYLEDHCQRESLYKREEEWCMAAKIGQKRETLQ